MLRFCVFILLCFTGKMWADNANDLANKLMKYENVIYVTDYDQNAIKQWEVLKKTENAKIPDKVFKHVHRIKFRPGKNKAAEAGVYDNYLLAVDSNGNHWFYFTSGGSVPHNEEKIALDEILTLLSCKKNEVDELGKN